MKSVVLLSCVPCVIHSPPGLRADEVQARCVYGEASSEVIQRGSLCGVRAMRWCVCVCVDEEEEGGGGE